MNHFAGLDISVKETSVCIVDDTGKIIREVKVASEPEALLAVLKNPAYHFKRIGLEAGPLSQWLFSALAEAELPVNAEVRTITAAIVAALFFGGVMQTSDVRSPILTQTHVIGLDLTVVSSKLDVKCGYFESAFFRRRFPGHVLGALEL